MMLEVSPRVKMMNRLILDALEHAGFSPHSQDESVQMMVERVGGVIYRLEVLPTHVVVDWYDAEENFAPALKRGYDSVNDLPKWAQERLAVLMVLDPSKNNHEIEHVGRRISEKIFWIFKGEDECEAHTTSL